MNPLPLWRPRLHALGSARIRLALLLAALAATTLTLLTSLPAHAEPTPTPTPSTATGIPDAPGQRTPTPQALEQIEEILREQEETLSTAAQEQMLDQETERLRKLLPDEGGVLGIFNTTDENGLPISAYTVKSDTGGLTDWDLGIQNLLTEFAFMGVKWGIAFCCWLMAWALSFGLAKLLMAPVLSIASSLHTRVILEMGLPSVFLAVCAVICTARILFGDKAKGAADAALSLVLAALATTLLVSTPQTLMGEETGALLMARGLALEVADVVLDANPAAPPNTNTTTPATPAALARPLTDALSDAFVVKPAMLLQYGRVFEGDCAQAYSDTKLRQLAYDRQVSARTAKLKKFTGLTDYLSPVGLPISSWYDMQIDMSTRWAVDHFGNPPMEAFEEKCVPGDVDSAKKASLDKVGGATFLLVATLIVTVLITKLAGSFLVAQCRIAWDAIRGEPALLAGTVPGAGRAYLWDWCASVLRSLGQMLWSVVALSIFIVLIQAVLDPIQTQWGRELTLRFLVIDVLCIAAIVKRKKIVNRSQQIANNFRTKMTGARFGGTHGSIFTPPAPTPAARRPRIVRGAARGLIRGAVITTALATGNPLTAAAYAMPSGLGATTLMAQLNSTGRSRRRRPPPRPGPRPRRRPVGNQPRPPVPETTAPTTPDPGPVPPEPTAPPQPAHPPQTPGTPEALDLWRDGQPGPGNEPADPARPAPQASRPVARNTHRADRTPPPASAPQTTPPDRATPGEFEAWLDEQEAGELARRRGRTPPRNDS